SDDDNNIKNDDKEKRKKDEIELNTEENKNQWKAIISQWIEKANYENQIMIF
ncbi:10886_t:CDS:2, partial [Funneliformis mosseae]